MIAKNNTESKTIELDEESKSAVTYFRVLLKEHAEINGWTDTHTDKYSTQDLVRLLIQYGLNDYQRGVNYDRALKEAE